MFSKCDICTVGNIVCILEPFTTCDLYMLQTDKIVALEYCFNGSKWNKLDVDLEAEYVIQI